MSPRPSLTSSLTLLALLLFVANVVKWGVLNHGAEGSAGQDTAPAVIHPALPARAERVVHVFVPLCDNAHQGIVPVPSSLGDGADPDNNLYWGAQFGLRTFFERSSEWQAVSVLSYPKRAGVLDRAAFRATVGGRPVLLIAEAYDGREMRAVLTDFFAAAAGRASRPFVLAGSPEQTIQSGGAADLICFVGHNGLMDIAVNSPTVTGGPRPKGAIVLACHSLRDFSKPLRRAGCRLLVGTAGLMAPEAYTLDAIVRSWAAGDAPSETVLRAGRTYARYQKISRGAGERLFVGAK